MPEITPRFDAVHAVCNVSINGKETGSHEGADAEGNEGSQSNPGEIGILVSGILAAVEFSGFNGVVLWDHWELNVWGWPADYNRSPF